jgi:hypothetical protein
MYFQFGQGIDQMGQVSEYDWTNIQKKPKKDVCHFAIVLKVLFQKWFH